MHSDLDGGCVYSRLLHPLGNVISPAFITFDDTVYGVIPLSGPGPFSTVASLRELDRGTFSIATGLVTIINLTVLYVRGLAGASKDREEHILTLRELGKIMKNTS